MTSARKRFPITVDMEAMVAVRPGEKEMNFDLANYAMQSAMFGIALCMFMLVSTQALSDRYR